MLIILVTGVNNISNVSQYILYHIAWADQRLAPALQIIVTWFTNGCNTVVTIIV